MTKRLYALTGVLLLAIASTVAQAGRTIQVDVTYTGAGTVDSRHRVYVALWDSTDFNTAPPSDVQFLTSKTGTVTFNNVQKSPVYISTAYDPTGKWDAQSPPPSGSSIGMYSKKLPTPEPIQVEAGKTARVKLSFDDANKVP
jgi:hypothetical protein